MGYTPQDWVDGSGGGTPITAARLGHIEDGIEALDTHAAQHASGGTDPVTPDAIGAYRAEYGIALNGYIDDALSRILGLETYAVLNSRQVTAGTGLTGGGDLTADRTLNVTYGASAGTAAEGDDSRFDAHTGTTLGFYSATPATKPEVTGSRSDGAALASLLTALATLGILTDSSSA